MIDKIKRLTVLTEKLRNHVIGYSEFHDLYDLLLEFNIFTEEEITKTLTHLGFKDIDNVYEKIFNYLILDVIDKLKVSKIIGMVSGGVMRKQLEFLKENR